MIQNCSLLWSKALFEDDEQCSLVDSGVLPLIWSVHLFSFVMVTLPPSLPPNPITNQPSTQSSPGASERPVDGYNEQND